MNKLFLVAAGAVALSGSLFADTITGTSTAGASTLTTVVTPITGTSTWTSNGTQPNPAVNGNPFWNNPSDDTFGTGTTAQQHMANVGYLLTDTGAFSTSTVGHPLGSDTVATDYQNTDGSDPTSFNIVRTISAETITLLFASGGLDTGNTPSATGANGAFTQIGYYSGTSYTGSNGTILYNSVGPTPITTPGSAAAFNATGTYGFFAVVCYAVNSCETYTTNGNTGPYSAAWDHFAAFQTAAGNWVIGFTAQNGLFGEMQGDFQDVVFEISSAVPEPGTIAIMGLGLAGLGVLGRRRFAKK